MEDYGSREPTFVECIARVRDRLLQVAGLDAEAGYTSVLLPGSGTYALESAVATLVPPNGKLLVLENGAYGRRITEIARRLQRDCTVLSAEPTACHAPDDLDDCLARDASITHVGIVHCETTSGIINPIEALAPVVQKHQCALLVDAMSSFGALEIDFEGWQIDCLVSSPNKCLEGVPGFTFAIARERSLAAAQGHCASLSLDLHAQWQGFERDGQFRFTPPTHALVAFDQTLSLFFKEGGLTARRQRYEANYAVLIEGMQALGLEPLVPAGLRGPIITAFPFPEQPGFQRDCLFSFLEERGHVLYPGTAPLENSFRVGTIGRLEPDDVRALLKDLGAFLEQAHRNRNQPVNKA